MNLTEKLQELGLELPEISTPGGNYKSVNIRNKIAYVAIQFPILNGNYLFQGKLGEQLTTSDGYKAMQLCALNMLAQISAKVGIENLLGLNHLDAYYQPAAGWDEAPEVVNGASDLFVNVLGDKGHHTRSILGAGSLPRNFSVGLTGTFTLN